MNNCDNINSTPENVVAPGFSNESSSAIATAGHATGVQHPEDILTEEFRMLFKPSLRKTIRKVKIDLEGEFTITHVAEINRRFSLALSHYDYFDFEIVKISAIDLAAIQLLRRLKMCYTAQGKFINVQLNLEPGYKTLLNTAGLSGI